MRRAKQQSVEVDDNALVWFVARHAAHRLAADDGGRRAGVGLQRVWCGWREDSRERMGVGVMCVGEVCGRHGRMMLNRVGG